MKQTKQSSISPKKRRSDAPLFARSQSELARQLGVNRQTVSYHVHKAEAPRITARGFHVAEWKEYLDSIGRQACPTSGRASERGGDLPVKDSPEVPKGVAWAFKRLEETEARTYRAMQGALASGEAWRIKATREAWLAVSSQLRRFDAALTEQRKLTGEVVERSIVERAVRGLSTCWKLSIRALINQHAPLLVALSSPAAVDAALSPLLLVGIVDSIVLISRYFPDPIPAWIISELRSGFDGTVQDLDACISERACWLAEMETRVLASPNSS